MSYLLISIKSLLKIYKYISFFFFYSLSQSIFNFWPRDYMWLETKWNKRENKNSNKWETVLSLEMLTILHFYHECLFTQYIPLRNPNFNITNTLNFDCELLTLSLWKNVFKTITTLEVSLCFSSMGSL